MLELLKKRRSIRKFKDKEIEEEKIAQLMEGALLSPSSRGRKPWEFIVITDKNILNKLSFSKHAGSTFLKNAPLGIVVLGNPDVSDVWVEDTSIATILIQLVAESIGLGSCWIQIRERNYNDNTKSEDYIRQIFNIPESIRIESIIAIGYPDEIKASYEEDDLNYSKVFVNSYKNQYNLRELK